MRPEAVTAPPRIQTGKALACTALTSISSKRPSLAFKSPPSVSPSGPALPEDLFVNCTDDSTIQDFMNEWNTCFQARLPTIHTGKCAPATHSGRMTYKRAPMTKTEKVVCPEGKDNECLISEGRILSITAAQSDSCSHCQTASTFESAPSLHV